MPHKLQLLIERKGDLLCVEVEGQLDSETAHQLTRVNDIAITDTTQSVRAVILNCKSMDYVSGLGWYSVLSLGRSLHGSDIKLMLIDLQPRLRVIFENCNYLGLLSIHRTMAGALEALPEPSTTSTTPSQPPSTQSPKPSAKTTSLLQTYDRV